MSRADRLGAVRDALAGIAAVAALLTGATLADVDRTAALRLIELRATCAMLQLERLAAEGGAS
jgi:hypothetical protein